MGEVIGDILPMAVGVAITIMAVLLLVLGAKQLGDAIAGLS
jgi:ABC-type nickel/cobalt efflux system permease component RcnA